MPHFVPIPMEGILGWHRDDPEADELRMVVAVRRCHGRQGVRRMIFVIDRLGERTRARGQKQQRLDGPTSRQSALPNHRVRVARKPSGRRQSPSQC